MSHGLGRMQRLILEALEPSQQVCRRPRQPRPVPWRPGAWDEPRHPPPCIPELCYGWLPMGVPWLWAQLPLDVYDLEEVRRVVMAQEVATWPPEPPLPRKATLEERAVWAISRYGQPNHRALGANIARAVHSLLERGALVDCRHIPLVRYIPTARTNRQRDPFADWIVTMSEEEAVLLYPTHRRVRFVTRGHDPKC